MKTLPKVNRVEVIDQNGRSYVNWSDKNIVQIDFQDDGRTMKVFISRKDYKIPKVPKSERVRKV